MSSVEGTSPIENVVPDVREPIQVNETDIPIEETAPELVEKFQPDANGNEVPPVESPFTFEN